MTRSLSVNTVCMVQNKHETLRREDWVAAGYEAFESGGIKAVKADRLARKLGVTRGSFYWHFKNIADLMEAILSRWKEQQTDAVIAANEEASGTAKERLLRLLKVCAQDEGHFEKGIRHWMTEDAGARAIVAEVDRQRTNYLQALLIEVGRTKTEASRLGPVAYAAWLGEYTGAVIRPRKDRIRNMDVLFELLIGD